MKLIELNPKWEMHGDYKHLAFSCPKCGSSDLGLSIPIPPHPKAWQLEGEDFETLSLSPSIDFKHGDWNTENPAKEKCHSHFFVKNGEILIV